MRRRIIISAVAVIAILSVSTPLYANLINNDPYMVVSWQDDTGAGGQWDMLFGSDSPVRVDISDKSAAIGNIAVDQDTFQQYLAGQAELQGSGLTGFSIAYDEDPYIIAGLSVLNGSGSTVTYTITFASPVVPIAPSSLYGGTMSGSYTADATPVTVSTATGVSLYEGLIDGSGVLSIYNDPSSWTTATSGNIPSVVVPTAVAGPAVNSTIGIQFKFSLTPGDVATMNGKFEVIPEPATLVLLGLGGFLVRRKK